MTTTSLQNSFRDHPTLGFVDWVSAESVRLSSRITRSPGRSSYLASSTTPGSTEQPACLEHYQYADCPSA